MFVGNAAVGRPHPSGFGESDETSDGTDDRGKNHMYSPDVFQFNAYAPPPLFTKFSPKELPGTSTMQPWLPFVWLKQSVERSEPVSIDDELLASGCVQPSRVWSEMLFCVARFVCVGNGVRTLRNDFDLKKQGRRRSTEQSR